MKHARNTMVLVGIARNAFLADTFRLEAEE